jgi:hypothetical protein
MLMLRKLVKGPDREFKSNPAKFRYFTSHLLGELFSPFNSRFKDDIIGFMNRKEAKMITARSPDEIKADFRRNMDAYNASETNGMLVYPITKGLKGALIGAITKYAGGEDNRRRVMAWLIDAPTEGFSSKSYTDAQWYAINKWVDIGLVDNDWEVAATFPVECALVLTLAIKRARQIKKPVDEVLVDAAVDLGGVIAYVTQGDDFEVEVDNRAMGFKVDENPVNGAPTLAEQVREKGRKMTTVMIP